MAYDNEIIRQRQQRRRQEAQRRKEQQQRLRKRVIFGLISAAVVLALCALVILLIHHTADPDPTTPSDGDQSVQTEPTAPQTVINLAFGGDLNITDKVVASGVTMDGYDYTDVFMDIVPLFAGADAAALNFEGNLCGAP